MNSNQRKAHNRLSDALASIDTAAWLAADVERDQTIPETMQIALLEATNAIIRLRSVIDTVVAERKA